MLFGKNSDALLERRIGHVHKAHTHMNGQRRNRFTLGNLTNVFFGKRRTLGNFGYNLVIVISIPEFFGKTHAQFAPSAAEFTTDSYNFIHKQTSAVIHP